VKQSQVPSLSPFPEFSINLAPINTTFDLSVRPRQSASERPLRRLTFKATDEMKQLRLSLERDFAEFSDRMKKLASTEPLNLEALSFPAAPAAAKAQPVEPVQKGRKGKEAPRRAPSREVKPRVQPTVEDDGEPSFSVASTFLMPDGSQFGS
jgi:hypothetical protein